MSETQQGLSPFEGTGFEFILGELRYLETETGTVKHELAEIEQHRQDAVLAAEEPFIEPTKDARARITQLETTSGVEKIVEKIQEADLDELSITALGIILRKRDTSLIEFAEGLKELSLIDMPEPHFRASRAQQLLTEFAGFRALKSALVKPAAYGENGGIPVGLFTIEWVEGTDAQADLEGRDASTGNFVKRVDAIIGSASSRDLTVVNRNIVPDELVPVLQPKSIVLGISDAMVVEGYEYWGEEKTDLSDATDQQIDLVSVPLEDEHPYTRPPAIEWDKGLKGEFPLIDSMSRHHYQLVENKARYIAWGTNVLHIATKLAADKCVAQSTRSNFKTVKERL